MKKKILVGVSISVGSSDALGFTVIPQSVVPPAGATTTTTTSTAAAAADVSHVTRGPAALRLPAARVSSVHAPAAAYPCPSMIAGGASPVCSSARFAGGAVAAARRALNLGNDVAMPSMVSGRDINEKGREHELPCGACSCADAISTSPSETSSSVNSGDRMSWDCSSCMWKGRVEGTLVRCSSLGRCSSGLSTCPVGTTAAFFAALPVDIASAVFPAASPRAAAGDASVARGDRGRYAVARASDENASAAAGRRAAAARYVRRLNADVAAGMEGHAGPTSAPAEAAHGERRPTVPVCKDAFPAASALHHSEICDESCAAAAAASAAERASQSAVAVHAVVSADDVTASLAASPESSLSAAGGSGAAQFGTAGFSAAGFAAASKRWSAAAAATRARADTRRCMVSGTPAASNSFFIRREGGGRQSLRRVSAAVAAVYLISAAVAEAIICHIDASEGLLAAAVAAGSALPAAEIYSFPLCRLPYLVNSDVPARDAPHIGLYTGGTIEIELELLPSESYANNLPLPEPRFHEKDTVFHLHRPQKKQRREDAETAGAAPASSPRRQNEQRKIFSGRGEATAAPKQQQQKDSSAAAPVGSVIRELASREALDLEVLDEVSSSESAGTRAARRGQATSATGERTAGGRKIAAAEDASGRVAGEVIRAERKEAGRDTATSGGQATGRTDGALGETEAINRSGVPRGWRESSVAEEEAIDQAHPLNEILFQRQYRIPEEEERSGYFSLDDIEGRITSSGDWETLQGKPPHASLGDGAAAFASESASRMQTGAAKVRSDVSGAVNIDVEDTSTADAVAAAANGSAAPANGSAAAREGATSPSISSREEGTTVAPSSSGSPFVLEMLCSYPSISSHVAPGIRAAVATAFSHVQRISSSLRVYLARFLHSVATAADLFFGVQSTPLLLPISLKTTSTRAHSSAASGFDTERAALSQPQPSSAGFSLPLLFPTLYYPTPPSTAPSSRATALSRKHRQQKQNQQQQRDSAEEAAGERQRLLDGAARRETMKNRYEAAAAAAAYATEEHGDVYTADVPLRSTAAATRPSTRDSDADIAAIAARETAAAPRRLLIEREWLPDTQAAAEDAGEEARFIVHDEERKERRTASDNSADGPGIRKASSGTTVRLGEESRTDEDSSGRKTETNRGEDKREKSNAADAHQQLFQLSPDDAFTALYEDDYVHDARLIQQRQQIAAAAAAWQRHLHENHSGPLQAEDPLIYTVNNTYVLVMNHFQYMLYQQDNGWLRSFTATDGAVANSYVPAYKRLTFTGPKLHARVEVPQLDRYAVVLLNADGLDLRLRGQITFLNPQHQQLSVEQIPLPKLLFFLMLMHFFTVVLLAVVMLSFRRRRWTRIHILILGNLLFCTLCFALDRSQTLYFEEHGQRNSVLWLAARVCKKLQDIVALMAFILIALGWKTLRSQLSRIEVQFVAGLCVISLYLGLFEIILGGFQGTRYILHALGYVCVLVAINFNLALLHSHIMDAGISATTSDLYHKYDAFRLYRGIFFLYLLKPVSLIFFKLSLLNPIYEQLLSWDEWIFVFANNAVDYGIFLALFYAFRPGGTMRILREVSQTASSDTQSGQAADANAWTPG